jgi:transcription-repair coupling factor (superfamily II helicase)
LARGLGVLPIDKQVEELKGWLEQMAAQIPGADGLTELQRAEEMTRMNEAVTTT